MEGAAQKKKFIGVRQRPSGKWVAEIKNTSNNIRMWLGTFPTAEQAARAYDEAACLLRGSNTRTNFTPALRLSSTSPLSLKIRNLLHKKHSQTQTQRSLPLPTNTAPIHSSLTTALHWTHSQLPLDQFPPRFEHLPFTYYHQGIEMQSDFTELEVENRIAASLYAIDGVDNAFLSCDFTGQLFCQT